MAYRTKESKKRATDKFKKKIAAIHGDRYILDLVEYRTLENDIKVICRNHGVFKIRPLNLRNGNGCHECWLIKHKREFFDPNINYYFKKRAIAKHGNLYNYDKLNYTGYANDVIITCSIHGDFLRPMRSHLLGSKCTVCSSSSIEKMAHRVLRNNSIEYVSEKKFKDLKDRRFDFYLPDFDILLELDGEQHFKATKLHGGKPGLKKRQENDRQKDEYALRNKYTLIRVPFDAKLSPESYLIEQLIRHGVFKERDVLRSNTMPKLFIDAKVTPLPYLP